MSDQQSGQQQSEPRGCGSPRAAAVHNEDTPTVRRCIECGSKEGYGDGECVRAFGVDCTFTAPAERRCVKHCPHDPKFVEYGICQYDNGSYTCRHRCIFTAPAGETPRKYRQAASWPELYNCLIFAINDESVYKDVVRQIEGLRQTDRDAIRDAIQAKRVGEKFASDVIWNRGIDFALEVINERN